MDERFIEIRFYYFVRNIVTASKYSIHVLSFIESICLLNNIDTPIIKSLVRDIRTNTSRVASYKEETYYIFNKMGYSLRDTARISGISKATLFRVSKTIDPTVYSGITRKLSKKEYDAVEKFMNYIDVIKELS